GAAPGAPERGTAVLVYLLIGGEPSIPRQVTIAEVFAAAAPVPEGATVGVTGSSASRDQQLATIRDRLPVVVAVTLLLIVLVLGAVFRSVVAPLVVLVVVGIAYVISMRVIGWSGGITGISAGEDVEPIVSALVIGLVTDYSVFHLFGVRDRLRRGADGGRERRAAAADTGAHYLAIIITAGVTTALGTAALLAGRLDFFRGFAPALALTAVVAVVVSVTLLPPLLALLGRAAYWPRGLAGTEDAGSRTVRTLRARAQAPLGARLLATRSVAALTALVVVAGLLVVAWQGTGMRLGLGLDSGVGEGASLVDQSFGPGYRAPTELLIEGADAADPDSLARVAEALGPLPGVSAVLGPGRPLADALTDVFVSPDEDVA
ncbi:MAG: MMPL family transporter, partial [Miltoncostaeaceae bacterium]